MASELKIFSLYQLDNEDKYYLIRTIRPSFSNASQKEEELAIEKEQESRTQVLNRILRLQKESYKGELALLGELYYPAIGDRLYTDKEEERLRIFYQETSYGKPWIVLGHANTEAEFLAELHEDEDLMELKPIGEIKQVYATFLPAQVGLNA